MQVPSKREVIERLLDQGMVMVLVDARRPGVRVPQAHRGDPQLRLNLSYRFSSHDLALDDNFVRCTLSFAGRPFYVELPLVAVFAVTSHVTGEALVWPESLAETLLEPMHAGAEGSGRAEPSGATPVQLALAAATPQTELPLSEQEPAPATARRSHLRLVK